MEIPISERRNPLILKKRSTLFYAFFVSMSSLQYGKFSMFIKGYGISLTNNAGIRDYLKTNLGSLQDDPYLYYILLANCLFAFAAMYGSSVAPASYMM